MARGRKSTGRGTSINFKSPEIPMFSVDLAAIQHSNASGMFHLLLYQSSPRLGSADAIRSIDADCVGRFAFSPQTMAKLIEMLQLHVQRFAEAAQKQTAKKHGSSGS